MSFVGLSWQHSSVSSTSSSGLRDRKEKRKSGKDPAQELSLSWDAQGMKGEALHKLCQENFQSLGSYSCFQAEKHLQGCSQQLGTAADGNLMVASN